MRKKKSFSISIYSLASERNDLPQTLHVARMGAFAALLHCVRLVQTRIDRELNAIPYTWKRTNVARVVCVDNKAKRRPLLYFIRHSKAIFIVSLPLCAPLCCVAHRQPRLCVCMCRCECVCARSHKPNTIAQVRGVLYMCVVVLRWI